MGLRFTSQLLVDQISDSQLEDRWEVIMPTLSLSNKERAWYELSADNIKYTPIVEEITFKPQGFKNEARRVRTQYINVPSDITAPGEINICMYCPGSMLTQYYIEAWKNLIYNPVGEYFYNQDNYKKNIEIYFESPFNMPNLGTTNLLGSNGSNGRLCSCHFTLQGCYPVVQDAFRLTYASDPKRLRLVQRFMFDRLVLENQVATANMIENIAGMGLNNLDSLITRFSTQVSSYSADQVYGTVNPTSYNTAMSATIAKEEQNATNNTTQNTKPSGTGTKNN